ncbi:hypothetical protein DYE48_19680 [Halobacillus trueperi]|uniref:Uncharacterized protein n=1 Tax=Halobacillus trueperi TaxID=156205 RepID=A0A3E0IZJ3_9BACI|nr:hypothetical protein DYE48_19680 [Halobacillus trueperi]
MNDNGETIQKYWELALTSGHYASENRNFRIIEHFQFEKIQYWEGIIMDWAEENATSVLHIC